MRCEVCTQRGKSQRKKNNFAEGWLLVYPYVFATGTARRRGTVAWQWPTHLRVSIDM